MWRGRHLPPRWSIFLRVRVLTGTIDMWLVDRIAVCTVSVKVDIFFFHYELSHIISIPVFRCVVHVVLDLPILVGLVIRGDTSSA